MTSKEFVMWMKGFTAASNEYNITPSQWLSIVDALNKVEDETIQVKASDLGMRTYTGYYPYSSTTTAISDSSNPKEEKTILND